MDLIVVCQKRHSCLDCGTFRVLNGKKVCYCSFFFGCIYLRLFFYFDLHTNDNEERLLYLYSNIVSRGFQTLWEGFSTLWTNCLGVDRGTIEDVSECEQYCYTVYRLSSVESLTQKTQEVQYQPLGCCLKMSLFGA